MASSGVKMEEQQQQEVAFDIETEDEQQPDPAMAPVVEQFTKLCSCCLQVTHSHWLDLLSILMVLLTCFTLSMYELNKEPSLTVKILDDFTFAFFILEMVIKMLGLGFVDFFKSSWNKFDVFINFGVVIDYILAIIGFRWPIFRALRPLRLVCRIHSLQALVAALMDTLPMLVRVFFLSMLINYIFSVVGVQLWAGQLRNRCFLGEDISGNYNVSLSPYYIPKFGEKSSFICSSEDQYGMQRCSHIPPYRVDGELCSSDATHHTSAAVPAVNGCVNWNQYYNVCRAGSNNPSKGAINFDNIGYSWTAIFQVVTMEGWSEIMYYVMDAHSYWDFIFFVFVTIMGSLVMMNVCGVVISCKFTENMEKRRGEQPVGIVTIPELCDKFKSLVTGILRMSRWDRVHPSGSHNRANVLGEVWNPIQRVYIRIVENKMFDWIITSAVVVYIFSLVIEHHEQPQTMTDTLRIGNLVLVNVFLVEMVLKLLAYNWGYFKDKNNIFDCFLVIISLWDVLSVTGSKTSVLRSLRLLRFMRLLHYMPYLKRQLMVLEKSIKKAASFFLLLLFFVFIFSIFGMLLFGGKFKFMTKHGEIITDRKNFDTLRWAMVTVFQVLTLEDWNLVLYNAMSTASPWAMIYFFLLVVLGTRVLLNVLVGMVYESFHEISSPDPASSENNSQQIDGGKHDPGPSTSSVTDLTPVQHLPLPDTSENTESLSFIQKVLQWCKDHEEWSFYVFSPQNRFRIICHRVISHWVFDFGILFIIFLSCVSIAVERPGIDPQSTERFILNISFYVISALFIVEMLLKVVALGLVFGKNSYCRSLWNIIDGLLVILSVVQILVSLISKGKTNRLKVLKVLRLLRTLRPLRVIKRAPRLKLAVEALIASVKPIGNILFICCTFLFFYGILGVQLFKGKFHHCLGRDIRNITTKSECLAANYSWRGKLFNFDSFPQALMSLFVMYSKDGWVNIMYDGLDAVGVDKQPKRNHNEWMLFFFIPFMILSFFLLDMFIGVMVETFHQCQQQQKRTDEQERREVLPQHGEPEQTPYFENYCPLRRAIHTLCTTNYLDLFVTAVLFLNVTVMGVEHYNQPKFATQLTEYFSYVFTVVFSIEILLKLVAFGVVRFLKDRLNLLDLCILLISLVSIISNNLNLTDRISINPNMLRIFRVLSLAQVLKAEKIRLLLKTVIKTLTQVGNICLLLIFFFFIYAALGVELFGKLECTHMDPCQGLHRYSNFKHFGTALLTLYKVCTGDNWHGILKDTLGKCPPDGCANYLHWAAPPYFITFVIVAQFVLLNLVVAVILQALEESKEEEEGLQTSVKENTGPVQPV